MPSLFSKLYALTQIKRTVYACIQSCDWRGPHRTCPSKASTKLLDSLSQEDWTTLTTINPNSVSSTAAMGEKPPNPKANYKQEETTGTAYTSWLTEQSLMVEYKLQLRIVSMMLLSIVPDNCTQSRSTLLLLLYAVCGRYILPFSLRPNSWTKYYSQRWNVQTVCNKRPIRSILQHFLSLCRSI